MAIQLKMQFLSLCNLDHISNNYKLQKTGESIMNITTKQQPKVKTTIQAFSSLNQDGSIILNIELLKNFLRDNISDYIYEWQDRSFYLDFEGTSRDSKCLYLTSGLTTHLSGCIAKLSCVTLVDSDIYLTDDRDDEELQEIENKEKFVMITRNGNSNKEFTFYTDLEQVINCCVNYDDYQVNYWTNEIVRQVEEYNDYRDESEIEIIVETERTTLFI